jgi:hypothetical protein
VHRGASVAETVGIDVLPDQVLQADVNCAHRLRFYAWVQGSPPHSF